MMARCRPAQAWPLADLLAGFAEVDVPQGAHLGVLALAMDSRRVVPGTLFLACRGATNHGMAFAEQARQRGALAIAAEPAGAWDLGALADAGARLRLPVIPVPGLSALASALADRFYGEPSAHLEVLGVAGVRGKTSVSHFLAQALSRQFPCGLIGNLGWGFLDGLVPGGAANAAALQETLAGLRAGGAQAAALALPSADPHQTAAIRLRQLIFTQCPASGLGGGEGAGRASDLSDLTWAVLNADDPNTGAVLADLGPGVRVALYGLGAEAPEGLSRDLWVGLSALTTTRRGLRLAVVTSGPDAAEVEVGVLGTFNAANLLAVLALLLARGLALRPALQTLARLQGVPGRMEPFGGDQAPLVAVDYAHTPDALGEAIANLRRHGQGRLITVFGCGGGHDRAARPPMGAVAEAGSDLVILTDDNPRGEDGDSIVAEILAGMSRPETAQVERSRGLAIRRALALAGTEDTVLVAGKGHETTQDFGELKVRFSDRAQVVQALREWTGGRL
jgi:UDP-N-acetylmuramoyl-L-alanyl-D-glutamate--2,6-diaminopimelate ligase